MPAIGKVFEFYKFGANFVVPLTLLYGQKMMVGLEHEIGWDDFGCCAFYDRLRGCGMSLDLVEKITAHVYPQIKKHTAEIVEIAEKNRRHDPLIVLVMNKRYLVIGDTERYDLFKGKKLTIKEIEKDLEMMEVSVCFNVAAIMIMDGLRFIKEYPDYAEHCPFAPLSEPEGRARKS